MPSNQPTTLTFTDNQGDSITIYVPTGAVTDTITLVYTDLPTLPAPPPVGFQFGGRIFDLDAFRNNSLLDSFVFQQPVTITITYSDADVTEVEETTLVVQYFDPNTNQWQAGGITIISRDPANNRITFTITHLTHFALFAPTSSATATVTPTGALPTATATPTPPAATTTPTMTPTLTATEVPATVIQRFSAEWRPGATPAVQLSWQTARESTTAGFYIYRKRNDGTGDFFPISGLAPSLGAQGGAYQYIDEDVLLGVEYSYLLVERKQDGALIEHRTLIQVITLGASSTNHVWLPLITQID